MKKYIGYYNNGALDFVRLGSMDIDADLDIRDFLTSFEIVIPEL